MKRHGLGLYILRDRKVLPVYDTVKWAVEFETMDRRVALTEFVNPEPWASIDRARIKDDIERDRRLGLSRREVDDIRFLGRMIVISTVFIGVDSSHHPDSPPLVFETMTFNGPTHDAVNRYAEWEEAEDGHHAAVEAVKAALLAQRAEAR